MKYGLESAEMIEFDRVFLNHENPRHEPFDSQDEVIDYLCTNEYVYELAKDLTKVGLNPLELFALLPSPKSGRRKAYVVGEGNRRLCALMLLNDPDLAPPKERRKFSDLAENWEPVPELFAIVFETKEDVDQWIERIHGGLQGGIGRKSWTAEQKTRFSGDRKNIVAQRILDYAEKRHMLSPTGRKGKITTAQRFLSNVTFREALGVDASNLEDLCRIRTEEDFDKSVKAFVADLLDGTNVNSRLNKKEIVEYARKFPSRADLSADTIDPTTISVEPTRTSQRKRRPKKPAKRAHLPYREDIHEALQAIPNYKLEQLYYSVCRLELADYTPLLSVGVWSFIESLSSIAGRQATTNFYSYLSKQKINSLDCMSGSSPRSAREALKRISDFGNTTKHDSVGAMFNGEQLANDFEMIAPIVLALAKEVKK
jgi:hypothetical protein